MSLRYDPKFDHLLHLQRTETATDGVDVTTVFTRSFRELEPHLPPKPNRWLDLGAGLGLLDVLIYRRSPGTMYLVDKSEIDEKPKTGFYHADEFAFYHDFDATRELLQLNRIPANRVVCLTPDRITSLEGGTFELIFSRLSWCFHYPFATYAAEVHRLLAPDGVLLTDCRRSEYKRIRENRWIEWEVVETYKNGYLLRGRKIEDRSDCSSL